MKFRIFLPVLAPLFVALVLPAQVSAQSSNVKAPNKNKSTKFRSVIVRGSGNQILSNSVASFIGGGQSNAVAQGVTNAMIGGGFGNSATNHFAAIVGGLSNNVTGKFAAVGGGFQNKASGDAATVGGGYQNTNSSAIATVSGGANNKASGEGAAVGGGSGNVASGGGATVGGGGNNAASGEVAVVGGGYQNTNSGFYGTLSGGADNTVGSDFASVPGGRQNAATNAYGFAAGRRAKTTAPGQFVWADSQDIDYKPSWLLPADTFNVRARGGVRFTSDSGGANQTVSWAPGGASWSFTSDAATKEDFRGVDVRDILRRVASMPVTEWNYIGYAQRHIGPTAQDWHAAFPLNESDKTVNTADMHGVSLAAIKGLVEELKDRDKAINELKAKNRELSRSIEAINARLNSLPPAP